MTLNASLVLIAALTLATSVSAAEEAPQASESALRSLVLDYETGPLRVFRNDNRYGENGNWYGANDVGQQRNLFQVQRLSAELGVAQRHTFILLYAPIEVTTKTQLGEAITFKDTRFESGTIVSHRYLFDGYRGSYLFRVVESGSFRWEVGASLQVRNAAVEMVSVDGTQFATENDIGLVFAVKTRLRYQSPWKLYAMLEADGLSTLGLAGDTEGGILDTALTLGMPVSSDVDFFMRLRFLGGGANVPERQIANWAWFGAAQIGVRADLVGLFRD